MKRCVQIIVRHAADMDRNAAGIFAFTRVFFTLTQAVSLLLLFAAPLCASPWTVRELSLALCHAAFRIAAMGVAAGFAADIIARRRT